MMPAYHQPQVPPVIAPPRGLSGLFEGESEPLDVSKLPDGFVLLNVYDVGDTEFFRKINKVTTASDAMLVGGVFHAGVELYGAEWCYGYTPDGSGVSSVVPRTHPQHVYRTTVPMGLTVRSPRELEQIIMKLADEWPGDDYSLIHHNCLHFCNALCKELGVGKIPGWVDRLARTAAGIDKTQNAVKKHTAAGAAVATQLYRSTSEIVQTADAQLIASKAKESATKGFSTLGSGLMSFGATLQSAIVGTTATGTQKERSKKNSKRQQGGYQGANDVGSAVPVPLMTGPAEDPFCPELSQRPTPQVSLEKTTSEAPPPASDPLPQVAPIEPQGKVAQAPTPQARQSSEAAKQDLKSEPVDLMSQDVKSEPADLMSLVTEPVSAPAAEMPLESPFAEPEKQGPMDLLSESPPEPTKEKPVDLLSGDPAKPQTDKNTANVIYDDELDE